MFENIRIVLVNPSHPGNIGAAARAMKNMGLKQLYLVEPEEFPHEYASARAAGADDILETAKVFPTLLEAVADCQFVLGTSARIRALPWPLIDPREAAEKVLDTPDQNIAIVFGRERTGLTNEELALCQYHINIPTESDFSSLNLAAAVQVMVYELKMAAVQGAESGYKERREVTAAELDGLHQHLSETMVRVGFLSPSHPKLLLQRMRRLLLRARVEPEELNILRGFLTAVDKKFE